jgi:hypothetical protein
MRRQALVTYFILLYIYELKDMYLTRLLGKLGTVCAHEKLPLEQLNTCGKDEFNFKNYRDNYIMYICS